LIVEMRDSSAYSEILAYFANYPPRSLMSDHSRATLFTLIRMLRPKVVVEVGTLLAGTTEVMARALWENAKGTIYTTDPLGAERCPAIIGSWPQELRDKTHFRPLNSMDFFFELERKHVMADMVLVDGNHDFEFALFDLQMAARLLRPGGIIVMDNAEQSGPFQAARMFMAGQPTWRELGGAIASFDPSKPFDASRASLPDTSFIVLQAPDCLPIGVGPHSWGQTITKSSFLEGFSLDLVAQVTAGTLSYQAILRSFTHASTDVPEIKTVGSFRIDLTGPSTTLTHKFEAPLRSDMQSRYDDAEFTVEIDLSWQADPGAPPLALASVPAPLAEA
jgi:predicted O-methyltransferase YrrM